ncbi:anti-sigma regulatory factor [Lentzea sp. NBRC 105346]|uniref:anti-sigma factor RsbA family regulatory protein n=1 Tax=Lentzea sp. NBRC 105346 TaxID=3032205 RepID=UPI0024A2C405|nr:anti-sigma factor RsbA family regulatory protein [Lentzea sp. NBRC 105346]GLZ33663.1 anti-sigma regulatory factor [Lentzea sp. NBRC 105346]
MTIQTSDPFVHEALLYRDEDDFLAGTAPFVSAAVDAGEAVLVAVPESGIALLRDELGRRSDRVSFLDMHEAGRNPGRILPGVLLAFSASAPTAPVRIIGEPIWPGRTELEYPACVQHEAMINSAFAGRHGTILCPYDARGLEPFMLHDAERTHPIVVEDRVRRPSCRYTRPEQLAEEFNLPLPPAPGEAELHGFSVGNLWYTRKLVETFAGESGLRRPQVEDLVLAVNELATNSILHATGHGVLRMWRDDATVVCEVTDSSRTPISTTLTGLDAFGMVMVNLLCDLVRTHMSHTGTTVRVYLSR